MILMAEVVRISDRFIDRRNPDSLDRQERLLSCMVLVSIFYAIMSIAFVRLSSLEHPVYRHHSDPDVAFELSVPPPEPVFQANVPPPTALTPGAEASGGRALPAQTSTPPKTPALAARVVPPLENHNIAVGRAIKEEAPISVVSTNLIKRSVAAIPTPPPAVSATEGGIATARALATKTSTPEKPGSASDNTQQLVNSPGSEKSGTHSGLGRGEQEQISGGVEISKSIPVARVAQGNITPYTNALILHIAERWRPTKKDEHVVLTLIIDKTGQLIDATVLESGGAQVDRRALKAVRAATFDPLPAWFKGEDLTFNVTLDRAELLMGQ